MIESYWLDSIQKAINQVFDYNINVLIFAMVELYDPQSISNAVNAIKDQDPTSDVCDFLSQP